MAHFVEQPEGQNFHDQISAELAKGKRAEEIASDLKLSLEKTEALIEGVKREEQMQMAKHSLEVEGFQVEDRHVELVRRVLAGELSEEEFDQLALKSAGKK